MQLSALTLALGRFVSELQRRKVIRVAAGYAVVGWIILQVAVALEASLNLPTWFDTVVVSLLALGFPVALIAAWFFDFTSEGVKRTVSSGDGALLKPQTTDWVLIGMLVVVAGIALFQSVMPRTSETAPTVAGDAAKPAAKIEPPALGDKSIAVLPFANLSPDKENEYFADGLTEELLNLLAKIGDLKVISRTSSFAFKGKNTPLPEIAKQLGVRHILEGSVRTAGDDLRVTAQLIDVSTDTHLWSETYERKAEEVFAVQDQIAIAIAQALKLEVTLLSRAQNPPTTNLQAYRLYLEGLNLYRNRGGLAPTQVTDRLLKAVALDPKFAEAHAALASSRLSRVNREYPDAKQQAALARESAKLAIRLKPSLALPHAVLGSIDRKEFAWESGMANLTKAVTLDPSDSVSRYLLGIMQCAVGQFEAASDTFAQVQRIDPLLDRVRMYVLAVEIAKGNHREAEKLAEQLARSPTATLQIFGNYHLATLAYDRGDAAKVATYYRDRPLVSAVVKAVRSDAFRERAIRDVKGEAASNPAYNPTGTFFLLKAWDEVFVDIGEYLSAGETWKLNEIGMMVIWGPRSKAFRDNPRFKQLLRDMGLVDYWKKHGWPDRCRAKGEDDFECS